MSAPASPIVKDFRYLREPHVEIARLEMHWTIFDGGVIRSQADLRQRGNQVRFQPDDLEVVRGDPSAPFEWNCVNRALCSQLISANAIGLIGPLAEMDLPSRRAVRLRQSLTCKRIILQVRRVKNEHERG